MSTPANAINVATYGSVFFETTDFTSITPGIAGTVYTSQGASSLPHWVSPAVSGFPYTDEAISFNAASNNGYFISANAKATLPASPAQGDSIAFAVDAATTVLTITANTGQLIRVGSAVSASAGTCVSSAEGDSIYLTYRTATTSWIAIGAPQGAWTVT